MPSFRVPGRLEVGTRIFGHLTVKDLIRLLLPLAVAYLLVPSIPGFLAAIVAGVTWYWWNPYGQNLDNLIRNFIRYRTYQVYLDTEEAGQKVLETENGFGAVLRVRPSNLDIKTSEEKNAVHSIYRELLDEVNYPLKIISRQQELSLENYRHSFARQDCPHKRVKAEYSAYCGELSERNLSSTSHYIVVRAEREEETSLMDRLGESQKAGESQLREELSSRLREIAETINRVNLTVQLL